MRPDRREDAKEEEGGSLSLDCARYGTRETYLNFPFDAVLYPTVTDTLSYASTERPMKACVENI